jgi:biopolymer transport protein ExbD
MSRRRRKRHISDSGDLDEAAELNIMPFIDVFSVLNTFLLMSAVFLSVGIIKVQVPYLTNKSEPTKPKRSMVVDVRMDVGGIEVSTHFSAPPENRQIYKYPLSAAGINDMHKRLVETRRGNMDTDLVTLYCEDEVVYEDIAKVLDAVKLRRPGDPDFNNIFNGEDDDPVEKANNKIFVYPKVVMGSVIL